jgi:hypothetical protein
MAIISLTPTLIFQGSQSTSLCVFLVTPLARPARLPPTTAPLVCLATILTKKALLASPRSPEHAPSLARLAQFLNKSAILA